MQYAIVDLCTGQTLLSTKNKEVAKTFNSNFNKVTHTAIFIVDCTGKILAKVS